MNTLFPSMITEWKKPDPSIRNSTNLYKFKDRLLQPEKPLENNVYTCHNTLGIKYLTSLRLGFSNLHYRKIKHCFLDAFDLMWSDLIWYSNRKTVYYFILCAKFPSFPVSTSSFNNGKLIPDTNIEYILKT